MRTLFALVATAAVVCAAPDALTTYKKKLHAAEQAEKEFWDA